MFAVVAIKLEQYPDSLNHVSYRVVNSETGAAVAFFGLESAAYEKAHKLNQNIGSFNGCPVPYSPR